MALDRGQLKILLKIVPCGLPSPHGTGERDMRSINSLGLKS